jgi:hypothetical protein
MIHIFSDFPIALTLTLFGTIINFFETVGNLIPRDLNLEQVPKVISIPKSQVDFNAFLFMRNLHFKIPKRLIKNDVQVRAIRTICDDDALGVFQNLILVDNGLVY